MNVRVERERVEGALSAFIFILCYFNVLFFNERKIKKWMSKKIKYNWKSI